LFQQLAVDTSRGMSNFRDEAEKVVSFD